MPLERFWLIHHDADLTETGSPQGRTYLKTIWEGFPAQQYAELEIIREWCRGRFGPEVAYVQGVAATPNWFVNESDENAFNVALPIVWGGYKTVTKRVVLGIGNRGAVVVHSDVEA